MKKIIALLLTLLVVGSSMAALAEDTGIQIIGGNDKPAEAVNLDNMKVGETVTIDGFGDVTITAAEWCDVIYQYTTSWGSSPRFASGSEAEYLCLEVRILNTQKKAVNYMNMFGDITCDFGDGYQFGGWFRQCSSDKEAASVYSSSSDSYDIGTLYAGRYAVVVTLPNQVVNSKEPLSVTFKIGENEFTYHHRK